MELHVHESGDKTAPAIVFLHGSPLSGRMWQPQLAALSEFHCLAPDLPGHGESAGIFPFTVPDAAERIAELIREAAPDGRAHIVGLSFGGVVAQRLMIAHPEVVDHVILSGTAPRLSKLLVAIESLNEPIMRLLPPEWLAALVSWQFGIPAESRVLLRDDFRQFQPRVFMQVLRSYTEIEIPTNTYSPTLVTVGQEETYFAKRAARELVSAISGAKGVMVPGAGHVWNMQKPDLFNSMVRAWVTDKPLSGELMTLR